MSLIDKLALIQKNRREQPHYAKLWDVIEATHWITATKQELARYTRQYPTHNALAVRERYWERATTLGDPLYSASSTDLIKAVKSLDEIVEKQEQCKLKLVLLEYETQEKPN